MQAKADSSLNLISYPPFQVVAGSENRISQGRFYQQTLHRLLKGQIQTNRELLNAAENLIFAAEHSLRFRSVERVKECGLLLAGLPLRDNSIKSIGHYYTALSALWEGQARKSQPALEFVADNATDRFRTRAILCLASASLLLDDFKFAISLYSEAINRVLLTRNGILDDLLTVCQAYRNISIVRSLEGDHRQSLQLLASIDGPVRYLRFSYPHEYAAYQNSLAVELAELGRIEEATYASSVALASPCAFAYPEWHETGAEIARRGYRASHSTVVNKLDRSLIRFPVKYKQSNYSLQTINVKQRVTRLQEYKDNKARMAMDSTINQKKKEKSRKDATFEEKQLDAMRKISEPDFPSAILDKILELIEQADKEQAK